MADEAQTPAPESAAAAKSKNKKINKLPLDQLNKKIDELEKAGQAKSKYFHQLILRRQSLQG